MHVCVQVKSCGKVDAAMQVHRDLKTANVILDDDLPLGLRAMARDHGFGTRCWSSRQQSGLLLVVMTS